MAPENLIDFVERIKWWGKHQLRVTFKSLPRRQTQKSPRVLNNLHLLFETVSCNQRPTDKDLPLYRNFEKKILSISQTNTRQSYVKNVLCYNVTPLFGLYCASTFLFSKAANQVKALGKKKNPKDLSCYGLEIPSIRDQFIHDFCSILYRKLRTLWSIMLAPNKWLFIIKTTTEIK